jgi:hypothetical protein
MSQSSKTKHPSSASTVSNAFANEMEDELDQIYHNFISRGTFELPISSEFVFSYKYIIFSLFLQHRKHKIKRKS